MQTHIHTIFWGVYLWNIFLPMDADFMKKVLMKVFKYQIKNKQKNM